jgi:hypothetical protein
MVPLVRRKATPPEEPFKLTGPELAKIKLDIHGIPKSSLKKAVQDSIRSLGGPWETATVVELKKQLTGTIWFKYRMRAPFLARPPLYQEVKEAS